MYTTVHRIKVVAILVEYGIAFWCLFTLVPRMTNMIYVRNILLLIASGLWWAINFLLVLLVCNHHPTTSFNGWPLTFSSRKAKCTRNQHTKTSLDLTLPSLFQVFTNCAYLVTSINNIAFTISKTARVHVLQIFAHQRQTHKIFLPNRTQTQIKLSSPPTKSIPSPIQQNFTS